MSAPSRGLPPAVSSLSARERGLVTTLAALVVLALLLPAAWGQGWHSHDFADTREWWGIPCALDVLSNLAFAIAGLWGWWLLRAGPAPGVSPAWWFCARIFFGGLLLTALGSAAYHWYPDDAGLLWDRAAMCVAFAGMLGLAVAERVGPRAARATAGFGLLAGCLALGAWLATGNTMPWAVLQFGGVALLLGLAVLRPCPGAPGLRLGLVVAIYAVAKVLEMADHSIWHLSEGWVAGHALKHVVAALAAWPVLDAWHRAQHGSMAAGLRHNAPQETRRAPAP